MPDADLKIIRQAVAEFQPRRRPRFQNLVAWQEVILELRGKGASNEAIAALLTRHGVITSRTMVGEFLLALSRPNKNRPSKRFMKTVATPVVSVQPPVTPVRRPEPVPVENPPVKIRGPHIAKVELLKPEEQYD